MDIEVYLVYAYTVCLEHLGAIAHYKDIAKHDTGLSDAIVLLLPTYMINIPIFQSFSR